LTADERLRFSLVTYGDFPVFRKDLGQLLARDVHDEARISEFFEPWERVGRQWGSVPARGDYLMRTDLQTYLSENCLVKTDRASMLASLEVRVPFLDELLLDRILPLHARQKIVGGQLKALLMPIARRLLPAAVWNRPKHGFNVPLEQKLAGAWRPAVEDALTWGERHLPMFNYSYLRRLQRISVTEGVVSLELWNPMVLLTWAMSQPKRVVA
jgi:asparagine synthase (glutamine-hydrolysing)